MAGRGRGLTLPAWMTEGGLKPIDPSTLEKVAPVQQTPAATTQTSTPTLAVVPTLTIPPANMVPPQRFIPPPMQTNGPRPPLNNPPFAASVPSMAPPFNNFAMHGVNNGFPIPGMINPFIPPMGQPNHFMNMGHGFPNPAMMPNFIPPPQMPAPLGFGASMPQQPKAPPPPAVIGDPNNDVSCWAEHESEAGKKYWFNRVSLVSTYDKPFCLKTPEERSIPPCEWKEYTSTEGKKYYSNGKESLWTMPEEFRVWKELVEAAEQKKAQQAAARAVEAADASVAAAAAASDAKNRQHQQATAPPLRAAPAVVYSSPAEAAEAFKELLADMKVTSIAKMREVQDLCQQDSRWEALKSQGEKKQALAEYQTRRLKQEKEQQKLKARKQRDAFLMMLAENTDIDARTRWRDATLILQDDPRYKNVEDARDREDLFLEFIVELEKKEKDDKRKLREGAIAHFRKTLTGFAEDGKIDHTSIWADSKKHFLDLIVRTEFRAMDDSDFRRTFQDFTAELLEAHRLAERKKKEDFERALVASQAELRVVLEAVASSGRLNHESRWREMLAWPEVTSSAAFTAMQALFSSEVDKDGSRLAAACKDVMGAVQDKLYEQYRVDRRLVKDILHAHSFKVLHDTSFPQLKTFALKVARVQECTVTNADSKDASPSRSVHPALESVPAVQLQEEGEEHDDLPGENLKAMMLERPGALAMIYAELHKKAVADHEEEVQYALKVEKKFLTLLAEHFYRVEHADIPWDEAKRTLQRRSVYDELSKTDRRRLFAEHMEALRTGKPRSSSSSLSLPGSAVDRAVVESAVAEGPHRDSQAPRSRRSESKNRHRSVSKDRRRERSYSHGRTAVEVGVRREGSRAREKVRERSHQADTKRSFEADGREEGRGGKRARTSEHR